MKRGNDASLFWFPLCVVVVFLYCHLDVLFVSCYFPCFQFWHILSVFHMLSVLTCFCYMSVCVSLVFRLR